MKRRALVAAAAATLAVAASAHAGEVAPDQVAFSDGAVATSLTGTPGDPANGRKVFMNRKKGNCLACHRNSDLAEQPFHGEIGPPLDGIASRRSEAEIRGILVNAKMTFEGTIMPSFYRLENGARTAKKFQGKTILTAQEVEDVLAYLLTLKE